MTQQSPCIFCAGTRQEVILADESRSLYTVLCATCGMTGPVANTPEGATQRWNALTGKACTHCIARDYWKKLHRQLNDTAARRREREVAHA